MTLQEYIQSVKTYFKQCGNHTDAETDTYFKQPDIDSLLKKHYDGFSKRNIPAYMPQATASCLDMMY